MLIDLVAGARPNFIKLAPVCNALGGGSDLVVRIVHTGQHQDPGMSDVFFSELSIPPPDVHLEVGSGSHGTQTARILERFEAHLMSSPPTAIVVFGDVNSTIACALAAAKLNVPVVHVEAGLRSFDRTMPEEVNRLLTDAIADLLLVPEPSGVANLRSEGIKEAKIRLVGNVMIDTLVRLLPRAEELCAPAGFGLADGEYGLVTLHRPSNVDDAGILERLLTFMREATKRLPLVFPVHPRTRRMASEHGMLHLLAPIDERFIVLDPQPYVVNLSLMSHARLVLTDSGGIQEESSWLRVPCLTLRDNTERPITTELGTSRLVGNEVSRIATAFEQALSGDWPAGKEIPLWDGHASERAANEILEWLGAS